MVREVASVLDKSRDSFIFEARAPRARAFFYRPAARRSVSPAAEKGPQADSPGGSFTTGLGGMMNDGKFTKKILVDVDKAENIVERGTVDRSGGK